uniref:Elongation of very long chain fatty acids protein n=1 Tax=Romanomermis culicivorax TaxID=13658 RepID=A0A915JIN9_ROMCU
MVYNYSLMFSFERHFDPVPSTVWVKANWMHSLTLSVIYILAVFGGQRLMAKRPSMGLQGLLTCWNAFLAVFSIAGTIRLTPSFFHTLSNDGLLHSMCVMDFSQTVTGFWTQMFGFSKAIELLDTVFIVLRKRPLVFLHWYHHVSVLVYTWHAYKDHTAAGRWFVYMNYVVHACMYTYYALRSMGYRLPKHLAMALTTMQILQMVLGCLVAATVYYVKLNEITPCQQTFESLYFSFVIYSTYFVLFAHFFYNTYMKENNKYKMFKLNTARTKNEQISPIVKEQNGFSKTIIGNGSRFSNGDAKKER